MLVSVPLPRGHFAPHGDDIRNATIQALAGESAQFDLGDVKPTAVVGRIMDFESLGQAAWLGGRDRCRRVKPRRGW